MRSGPSEYEDRKDSYIRRDTLTDADRFCLIRFRGAVLAFFLAACLSCSGSGSSGPAETGYALDLAFARVEQASGPYPFTVTATLTKGGIAAPGLSLDIVLPKGSRGVVADHGDGTYSFTVTPSGTGLYPVTVSCGNASVSRTALVLNQVLSGAGQPLLVPGLVNTEGYEDGVAVTPDGRYLFVQYGPIYFSGLANLLAICAKPGYSLYCLGTYPDSSRPDLDWVFKTRGPYAAPLRPGFPTGAIADGLLTHLNVPLAGVCDKIACFPTVFYGFKRQADGTFAAPFKVAFDDAKGANGPFGLSFVQASPGSDSAIFAVAWNDYFDPQANGDKANVWTGSLTLGQDASLGSVVYSGELFSSITPTLVPAAFTKTAAGAQGNPHLYADAAGVVQSVWTDDEAGTHAVAVQVRDSGDLASGTWHGVALPAKINGSGNVSQPFFTGTRLYLNRETRIVYHEYSGADSSGYGTDADWGPEVVVLRSDDASLGGIFGVGEPTLCSFGGKVYLYFAYVEARAASPDGSGRTDYDLGAAYVQLPD